MRPEGWWPQSQEGGREEAREYRRQVDVTQLIGRARLRHVGRDGLANVVLKQLVDKGGGSSVVGDLQLHIGGDEHVARAQAEARHFVRVQVAEGTGDVCHHVHPYILHNRCRLGGRSRTLEQLGEGVGLVGHHDAPIVHAVGREVQVRQEVGVLQLRERPQLLEQQLSRAQRNDVHVEPSNYQLRCVGGCMRHPITHLVGVVVGGREARDIELADGTLVEELLQLHCTPRQNKATLLGRLTLATLRELPPKAGEGRARVLVGCLARLHLLGVRL